MGLGNTQVGYGATLTWDGDPLAKITKIGEFGFAIDKIDISTFDATNAFKVSKAGLIDPGEIACEGTLSTNDAGWNAAYITDGPARSSKTFIITLPTSLGTCTFTGTGFLSEWKVGDITPDGVIMVKFKIQATGVTTLASAA